MASIKGHHATRLHRNSPNEAKFFLANVMWLFKNYGNCNQLAEAAGVSSMYIRNMCQPGIGKGRGATTKHKRRPVPSLSTASAIAKYFGYELHEMLHPKRHFLHQSVKPKPPTPPLRPGRGPHVKEDLLQARVVKRK